MSSCIRCVDIHYIYIEYLEIVCIYTHIMLLNVTTSVGIQNARARSLAFTWHSLCQLPFNQNPTFDL